MLQTAPVGVFIYARSDVRTYLRKWLALEPATQWFQQRRDFTHRLLLPAKVRHVRNISFCHCKTNRYPKRWFAKTNSRSHRQAGDGEPKRRGAVGFTYVRMYVRMYVIRMYVHSYVSTFFGGVRLRPSGRRTYVSTCVSTYVGTSLRTYRYVLTYVHAYITAVVSRCSPSHPADLGDISKLRTYIVCLCSPPPTYVRA